MQLLFSTMQRCNARNKLHPLHAFTGHTHQELVPESTVVVGVFLGNVCPKVSNIHWHTLDLGSPLLRQGGVVRVRPNKQVHLERETGFTVERSLA